MGQRRAAGSCVLLQGGAEMDAGELFATAVPGEQLEARWERALRRIFGPSRCLCGVERPREAGPFAAVVQGRMREQ